MLEPGTRLILLRHGEVASHRGDVPITDAGADHAQRTGSALGASLDGPVQVLFGGTRRTRETAEALVHGYGPGRASGPRDSFALRNPDMYLAGSRVNMVSSAEALAEQVSGMTSEQAAAHPWWSEFFTSSDRIGRWLADEDPPGETATGLTDRILRFARSLGDLGPTQGRVVVAVTHSPVLRSLLRHATGRDPGEPAYVTGADVRVDGGQTLITPFDPLA